MRRPILLAVLAAVVVIAPRARADDRAPDATHSELRPIRYVSVEGNPLALLAGRAGGQAQIGVYGPLVLSVAASRLSLPGTQRYSEYDETTFGNPALRGWSLEIGPRFYAPLSRPPGRARVDLLIAFSYVRDTLHEDGVMRCTEVPTGCATGPAHDLSRSGVAVDVGVQVTAPFGLYALAGLGHEWVGATTPPIAWRAAGSAPVPDLSPADAQRGQKWPRLLLSIGWAI